MHYKDVAKWFCRFRAKVPSKSPLQLCQWFFKISSKVWVIFAAVFHAVLLLRSDQRFGLRRHALPPQHNNHTTMAGKLLHVKWGRRKLRRSRLLLQLHRHQPGIHERQDGKRATWDVTNKIAWWN